MKFIKKSGSKAGRADYRIIGVLFYLSFMCIGGLFLFEVFFPGKDSPTRSTLESLAFLTFGLGFTLGPLSMLAMLFGLHVPLQNWYDRKLPPIVDDADASDQLIVRCGVQHYGLGKIYAILLPLTLLGVYLLSRSIMAYAGWAPFKEHKSLIMLGVLLTVVCGGFFLRRNTVVFDRTKKKVRVYGGFLFRTRRKMKVDWQACESIHITRRQEYRQTTAGKIEMIVPGSGTIRRSPMTLKSFYYSPLIIKTNDGEIEVKQFISWWLASRLARKISHYTGIPIGDSAPRPDHRRGENVGW